jgi:tetratricopeptide (TPR) repeat protein
MKITEHRFGEATDPNSRMQRLTALLSAWRFPRYVYWAERGVPPPGTEFTAGEMALWLEILRAAQPVPPRNHLDGLRVYARLHGVRVEDLERDKAVLIIGEQVAARGQAMGLGLLGHRWSLLVPAQIGERETEPVLSKRFQEVGAFGEEVLASGSWSNCTDSIAPLVSASLTASSDALTRLWQISLALSLEYRFLPALPAAPAKALADLLGARLAAAADHLTVETDARLLRFALGRDDASPAVTALQLPESRLARLLEIDRFFEHARHRFSDAYYDEIASAFARIAAPFDLGNVLLKLEPGSALISALDAVCLDRPECIAAYVWHAAFCAEGAHTLLQLPQRMQFGHQSNQLEVTEEWLQAQQLGRELLLLGNQPTDWSSLVALGIHDESQAIGRRHYGVAPIDRGKSQYDGATLWASAVADTARSLHLVDALEKHLQARTRQSDSATIFALRLLRPLRESGQAELATRLASAVIDSYVAALSLDAGFSAIPSVLCAYGELLGELRQSLDLSGASWRNFLRPFDAAKYLQLALDDQPKTTSSTNSASFNVPRILRAHAETLIALASAGDAFEEPLKAALELRDVDRKAALHVGAFSWTQLARITSFGATPVGEPLFVAIGKLFARVAGSPSWLDDFLGSESEAHILAGVAAGLGASHALAKANRPKLRARLEDVLNDEHGVALGHALELANLLQLAAMPDECERFARKALTILDNRSPRGHDAFSPVARALLAGALAQQGRWPDILAFEPDRNLIVLSPHARFVENMRALALMESDRLVEAEEALRRLLQVDASNAAALVNLTALHLRAQDWLKVIAAAENAKQLLSPGDNLDHILLNEAHAREKLGDRFAAATLLDELSGSARTRPDVVAARDELRHEGGGALPPATEVAAGSAVDAPPLDALLNAVETAESADEKGRALEQLMARLFGTVAGFQVTERVRTATEEIDITVLNGSTDPRLAREEALLLAECKNWSSKCGKNEFVILKAKVENRSQRCSLGFLVSWNGFAETVTKEMLRGSRERTLIVPITGEQVRQAVRSGKFAEELHAAWQAAVLL